MACRVTGYGMQIWDFGNIWHWGQEVAEGSLPVPPWGQAVVATGSCSWKSLPTLALEDS